MGVITPTGETPLEDTGEIVPEVQEGENLDNEVVVPQKEENKIHYGIIANFDLVSKSRTNSKGYFYQVVTKYPRLNPQIHSKIMKIFSMIPRNSFLIPGFYENLINPSMETKNL